MTRAPQPGLLCRAWFRHTARRNRKARIQAAAERVWRQHITSWVTP